MNDFETVRKALESSAGHWSENPEAALDRIEAEVERLRADEEVWTEENDQLRAELDTMQKALDDMNEKVVASWGVETNLKLEVERLRADLFRSQAERETAIHESRNLEQECDLLKVEVERLREQVEQDTRHLDRLSAENTEFRAALAKGEA